MPKLEAGNLYKTRNGTKIEIYRTDRGGKYPVHGAYFENDFRKEWKQTDWTLEGQHTAGDISNLDIIAPWTEDTGQLNLIGETHNDYPHPA
jgi:hypothetical protein